MGMIIAAIAIGALLSTIFAIGVERRSEWKMRERRIELRQTRVRSRATNSMSTDVLSTPNKDPLAPSASDTSPNRSRWWRQPSAHRRRIVRLVPTRSAGS